MIEKGLIKLRIDKMHSIENTTKAFEDTVRGEYLRVAVRY